MLKYDPKAREHLNNVMNGKGDPDALKKYLGAVMVGTLKRAMRGEFGKFEGLSEATKANRRKPHNGKPPTESPVPLVDSGLLVNSATFEIEK